MQHETGPLAMECHERCARFHIMALHLARKLPVYNEELEIQQLQNSMSFYTYLHTLGSSRSPALTSLKEFYDDRSSEHRSPAELEMRVYRRLLMIRAADKDVIPTEILDKPVFSLATQFRDRVHKLSQPIRKKTKLVVDAEAMQIFAQLAAILREQNSAIMMFLVACVMQYHFGEDCIDNIDDLRGDLSIPDIIDGVSDASVQTRSDGAEYDASPSSKSEVMTEIEEDVIDESSAQPVVPSATEWLSNNFPTASTSTQSAFAGSSAPHPSSGPSSFAGLGSVSFPGPFGSSSAIASTSTAPKSAFGNLTTKSSVFGGATFGPASSTSTSTFANGSASKSVFGDGSPTIFGNASTINTSPFGAQVTQDSPAAKAPLAREKTWPAVSSLFGGESSAPSASAQDPILAQSPPLNPFASSFTPTQATTSAFASIRPPQPPSAEKSSIFGFSTTTPSAPERPSSGAIFDKPLTIPTAPTPAPTQVSAPPLVTTSISAPAPSTSTSAPTPWSTALSESSSQDTVSHQGPVPVSQPETPSRIVERRQTLWEYPGSSSPFQRLKEERLTFTPQPGSSVEPRTPISPTAPPPALGRVPTMALPPTPTARWFESPSYMTEESDATLSKKRSLLHFPSITLPSQPSTSDILSPISLTTPGKNALGVNGAPSLPIQSQPTPAPVASTSSAGSSAAAPAPASAHAPTTPTTPVSKTPTGSKKPVLEIQTNGFAVSPSASLKGKEKGARPKLDKGTRDAKAAAFLRASLLVRECWAAWRRRREVTKAWDEAVRRGDSYKAQVERVRTARSPVQSQAQKRRRASALAETAQARRTKRRKSSQFVQPLTDEALAERLQKVCRVSMSVCDRR